MFPVDLRSDTLTLPTDSMREAMRNAEVGDDGRLDANGRGEDPSINRLEDLGAEITGKEAGLLFPSGTMANFASLLTHCARGDGVACDPELHVVITEKAAFMDRFGGLSVVLYKRDEKNMPEPDSFAEACASPNVRLACVENTHNFAGGTCTSLERQMQIAAIARDKGRPVHMDGARIFNAALALGIKAADLAAGADSIQFCLSKGLGAPVGSLLCGSKEFIKAAKETRKYLGGAMRQAGVFASAGLVALAEGIDRLAEDHENAQLLGKALSGYAKLKLVPVQTNIVMLNVKDSGQLASWFEEGLKAYGILAKAMGKEHLRFTTYRGVTRQDIERAASGFQKFMEEKGKAFA